MVNQLSWKVGGQQGEGIESTGEIFSMAINRLGYYLYGYRHFSSRIKGGHTNNKIRVSTTEVRSIADDLDILVAFDQETIEVNYKELNQKGIIIADAKFNPKNPEDSNGPLYAVPFTEIAAELRYFFNEKYGCNRSDMCLIKFRYNRYFKDVVEKFLAKKAKKLLRKIWKPLKRVTII